MSTWMHCLETYNYADMVNTVLLFNSYSFYAALAHRPDTI